MFQILGLTAEKLLSPSRVFVLGTMRTLAWAERCWGVRSSRDQLAVVSQVRWSLILRWYEMELPSDGVLVSGVGLGVWFDFDLSDQMDLIAFLFVGSFRRDAQWWRRREMTWQSPVTWRDMPRPRCRSRNSNCSWPSRASSFHRCLEHSYRKPTEISQWNCVLSQTYIARIIRIEKVPALASSREQCPQGNNVWGRITST